MRDDPEFRARLNRELDRLSRARHCQEHSIKRDGYGPCNAPYDKFGRCPKEWKHVENRRALGMARYAVQEKNDA